MSAFNTTVLIDQLKDGDTLQRETAATDLWERFAPRLLQLARRRMEGRLRQRESAEDVVQSAYKSFCLRHQRGEFDLSESDDLWKVLVTITRRKIANVAKKHHRMRRDCRRDRPVSARCPGDTNAHDCLPAESTQWQADQIVMFQEEFDFRLAMLTQSLRQIAIWKLEGYSNEEIAGPAMMDCAVRTVERKLARIRREWADSVKKRG